MLARCYKESHRGYKDYGGKGVYVCEEWKDAETFCKWALRNGYKEGMQIDRKDNNGNYEPSNCHWVTPKKNSRNRRNTVYLTIGDKTKCVAGWCEVIDISPFTIYWWIKKKGKEYAQQRIKEKLAS